MEAVAMGFLSAACRWQQRDQQEGDKFSHSAPLLEKLDIQPREVLATEVRKKSGGNSACLYVATDEPDDIVHGSPGTEDGGHAGLFQSVEVLIGNGATEYDNDVVHLLLAHQLHHARYDGIVRAGEDREADHVHILLQRGGDDHLRCLPESGVDD